jgi:hypothetical protein
MKRSNLAGAFLVFIASGTLYGRTLAPSLLFGDSAEFQTIAYTLGMGHPTGYPVYVLLAKAFTLIPIGEIAYRVNLFSAFCAALTVGLLYLILRSLGARTIPALCGAVVPALGPLFWKYASLAEVYVPAAACLAFILFAVLQWRNTGRSGWLFVAGFCGGLSLGIHTMVAISGIAILLCLILSAPSRTDWLQAAFGALAGSAAFLASFLFLDALNSPAGYYDTVVRPSLSVWGMTPADFDSPFERLVFLYFPPQFKGEFFAVPFDEVMIRLTDFINETSWILWLAIPGFIYLLLRKKTAASRWREAILLAFILISFLVFGATYNVFDYYVYYIPILLVLGILVGLGVDAFLELIGAPPKMPRLIPVGLGILILGLAIYQFSAEISTGWRERIPPGLDDWETYYYRFPEIRSLEASQAVNHIEDNAIVFTDWDQAYGLFYASHVMQGRTSMSFHETYPQEGVTQFAKSAVEYIEANIDTRPIYFSERPSQLSDRYNITRASSGLFKIEKK